MASEDILEVRVRRHVFDRERPFSDVIAPYRDAAAAQVAERLDAEVLGLLRQVTAAPEGAQPCP